MHSWLPRDLKTGVNFVSVVWRCQPVGGGGNSPARGGIQPWVGVFFLSGFFFSTVHFLCLAAIEGDVSVGASAGARA